MTIESIEFFFGRAGIAGVPKPAIINRFIDKELCKIIDEDLISLRIKLLTDLSAEQLALPIIGKLVDEVYEELKHRSNHTLSFCILKKIELIRGTKDLFTPSESVEEMVKKVVAMTGNYPAYSDLENSIHGFCVRRVLLFELNHALDDVDGIGVVAEGFEHKLEVAAAVPLHR